MKFLRKSVRGCTNRGEPGFGVTFDTGQQTAYVTRQMPPLKSIKYFQQKMSERREEEGEERETNNHHASSMSTEEALQIRDSTKDLMQLSITEREQRVDASVNLAFKDTIFTSPERRLFRARARLHGEGDREDTDVICDNEGRDPAWIPLQDVLGGTGKGHLHNLWLNNATLAKTSFFLTKSFPVDVYAAFPRGYGSSSGKRGYAKHRDDYFSDMADIIEHIRRNANPGLPIIIGGSSSPPPW